MNIPRQLPVESVVAQISGAAVRELHYQNIPRQASTSSVVAQMVPALRIPDWPNMSRHPLSPIVSAMMEGAAVRLEHPRNISL